MLTQSLSIPHLTTAHTGPLRPIESIILSQIAAIEAWFRAQWRMTPPPITSSVDLRHAGFKLSPVDTNLFPAGFNNLNPEFLPLCVQAAQSYLYDFMPGCTKVMLVPESHTRNQFYLQNLAVLQDIFVKAGFVVRVGSLDPDLTEVLNVNLDHGLSLRIEPIIRQEKRVGLFGFDPCFLLLNNDLSSGIPDVLNSLEQPIQPPMKLGWSTRLKTRHFSLFADVAHEFSQLLNIDSWLINPLFSAVDGVDFMSQVGLEKIVHVVDDLLVNIQKKYDEYGISEKPFVVVKSDSGTYGMSVMMVHEGAQLRQLNRKQRTRMSATKGGRVVSRVIVQEGITSVEAMPDHSVAEPVVYMIGQFVVGGFYRVHKERSKDQSLNAPGMYFEPLAFAQACNLPSQDLNVEQPPNRFYIYSVIARLAALAAAREMAAVRSTG